MIKPVLWDSGVHYLRQVSQILQPFLQLGNFRALMRLAKIMSSCIPVYGDVDEKSHLVMARHLEYLWNLSEWTGRVGRGSSNYSSLVA